MLISVDKMSHVNTVWLRVSLFCVGVRGSRPVFVKDGGVLNVFKYSPLCLSEIRVPLIYSRLLKTRELQSSVSMNNVNRAGHNSSVLKRQRAGWTQTVR